jgi:ribosomal protein S18 acetylase RimI-like enzyme
MTRRPGTAPERIASVVARAMQRDPLHVHFTPDRRHRRVFLTALYRLATRYLLGECVTLLTTGTVDGVSFWHPPRRRGLRLSRLPLRDLIELLRVSDPRAMLRMMRYQRLAEGRHRHHMRGRHWYLTLLAVAPERQGRGLASTLVRPILKRADAARLPCYLETQNAANLPIYRHFGFRVLERLRVPGSRVSHWCLLRAPQPVA